VRRAHFSRAIGAGRGGELIDLRVPRDDVIGNPQRRHYMHTPWCAEIAQRPQIHHAMMTYREIFSLFIETIVLYLVIWHTDELRGDFSLLWITSGWTIWTLSCQPIASYACKFLASVLTAKQYVWLEASRCYILGWRRKH